MIDRNLEISQEIFIPIPVDQVWNFLMDQNQMKNWFRADKFVIDIWEGGEIEIPISFGDYECHAIGEIGLVLPKRKFAFVWRERDEFGDEWFNTTTVTLNLEEKNNGSHVKLVHSGFTYLPKEIQQETLHRYSVYWKASGILERLSQLVSVDGNELDNSQETA
jgi:uncharacterized protein YndB with AHSA1/START domain